MVGAFLLQNCYKTVTVLLPKVEWCVDIIILIYHGLNLERLVFERGGESNVAKHIIRALEVM